MSDLLSEEHGVVEFYVAAPDGDLFSDLYKSKGKDFFNLPHRRFKVSALIKLLAFCKRNKIKVVHSHGRGAGIYSRALKIFGFKVIHTFHGVHIQSGLLGKVKLLTDRLLKSLTDKFICVSEGEKLEAVKHKVTKPQQTLVIPNGVRIFDFVEKKENDPLVLGSLSRLNHQKGIDILIDFFSRYIKQENEKFIIKIAGDGEEKNELVDSIRRANLEDYIYLVGPTNKPYEFLASIDVYISFSRFEGMPLSVLEAISNSIPCLLSRVVGNEDIIIGPEYGLLFELNDYSDFRGKLKQILNDEKLRASLRKKAHALLIENFSVQAMVFKTIEVYR